MNKRHQYEHEGGTDHHHEHEGHSHPEHHHRHHELSFERKTGIVVLLTAATMVVEIIYGYLTSSMALLADGFHMLTHVFALGLSWLAYVIARKYSENARYSFKKEKLLTLSGFTSALVLEAVAIVMAYESIIRLMNPLEIIFRDAILVAVIGLAVNALSAILLHHKHSEGDHNIRSAYLHVLADGLTSLTAIAALLAGMYYNLYWLDAASGILSAIVITKWSVELIVHSGRDLIDFKKSM